MSLDGFTAAVKIDEIEISAGKHNSCSSEEATMKMTGVILACIDADFQVQYYSKDNKKKTYVYVEVKFQSNPDNFYSIPDELVESCVGTLDVKVRETQAPHSLDDSDIRAHIALVLGWNMFDKLLAIKEHTLIIEPLFYRDEDQKNEKLEIDEAGRQTRYIKRIYFSTYIESEDT